MEELLHVVWCITIERSLTLRLSSCAIISLRTTLAFFLVFRPRQLKLRRLHHQSQLLWVGVFPSQAFPMISYKQVLTMPVVMALTAVQFNREALALSRTLWHLTPLTPWTSTSKLQEGTHGIAISHRQLHSHWTIQVSLFHVESSSLLHIDTESSFWGKLLVTTTDRCQRQKRSLFGCLLDF